MKKYPSDFVPQFTNAQVTVSCRVMGTEVLTHRVMGTRVMGTEVLTHESRARVEVMSPGEFRSAARTVRARWHNLRPFHRGRHPDKGIESPLLLRCARIANKKSG